MIADINRKEFPDRFLLKGCDNEFTWIDGGGRIFDLTEHKIYNICDIANREYSFMDFYRLEGDEDFLGVYIKIF